VSVNRYDRIDAPDWMTQSFTQTPEGFLTGRACVTNIGVFPYRMDDGSIEMELRHPDDVFEPASMDSLKLKPITNDHPPVLLTPDNVAEYQVGNVGDNPINGDNIHLTIDATFQAASVIKDIMAGKQELSCGYSCDLVDESGDWLGVPYNKRQKNIRYNHVAVVDKARAGEAAHIKLDAGDAEMINMVDMKTINSTAGAVNNKKEDTMSEMKTVKLDGVDYQAEAQVITALNTAQKNLDAANVSIASEKEKVSKLEAERDTLKETNEQLKKDAVDEQKINALVEAKLRVLNYAAKAKVEVKKDMDDAGIKKAVILAKFPAAKLDGKDAVYINSRFDCACEEIDAADAAAATASVNTAGGAAVGTNNDRKDDAAQKAYIARLRAQGAK
jgi:uncharacterized protein